MNVPIDKPVTTNILRHCYERGDYSFGSENAPETVVLVGSCRVVPFLNFLRVCNMLSDRRFRVLCFDPVEMWKGPGHDVAGCVNDNLSRFRFGKVDYLVCEHLQHCGVLNTVRTSEENVFDSLGCVPVREIRLPNWNDIHIFDEETCIYYKEYAESSRENRVSTLRFATTLHKAKFLGRCALSSFPQLADWVDDNWLAIRLGWTSNHPSHALTWRMIGLVADAMGIAITPEIAAHPFCATDTCASTGMRLNDIDYEANNWKF